MPQLNRKTNNILKNHASPGTANFPKVHKLRNKMGTTGKRRPKEGWWVLPDQRVYVLEQLAHQVVLQQLELTHLGKTTLECLLSCYYVIARLPSLCTSISQHCPSVLKITLNKALMGSWESNAVVKHPLKIWRWTLPK